MTNSGSAGELSIGDDSGGKWKWLNRGLLLKLVAIGLLAFLFLLASVLVVAHPQSLLNSRVGYSLGAVLFTTLVLDVASAAFCFVAPITKPMRLAIAGTIGCQIASLIVFITALATISELDLPARIFVGGVLAGCVRALAAMFFVVFIRNIAIHVGRDDLAFSPISVLLLSGGALSTTTIIVVIMFVLLLCPCMWWLIYAVLAAVQQGWQQYGLPETLLGPTIRLVPVLCLGLLFFGPLYRYGRLLSQLRTAIDQFESSSLS